MPTKLKITEQQLLTIINQIQNDKPIGFITENIDLLLSSNNSQPLNEGWKDVVLGTAMLLGMGMTGVNAQIAKKALNDSTTLSQIERTLETEKIKELADTLEKAGLKNAMDKIEKNAETLKNNFDKVAKDKGLTNALDIYTTKNITQTKSKVRQGYSVSDVKITSDTIVKPTDTLTIDGNLELTYGDNTFKTGSYNLNNESINDIKSTIKSLIDKSKITNIVIEASTDKEPSNIGNNKLASLRANSVKSIIDSLGLATNITIKILPNQGPDIYKRDISQEERINARKETEKFRYIKINMEIIANPKRKEKEKLVTIVQTVEYALVKSTIGSGKVKKKDGSLFKEKPKKFSCIKLKLNGKPLKCPNF